MAEKCVDNLRRQASGRQLPHKALFYVTQSVGRGAFSPVSPAADSCSKAASLNGVSRSLFHSKLQQLELTGNNME